MSVSMAMRSSQRLRPAARPSPRPASRTALRVCAFQVTFKQAAGGKEATVECAADDYLLDAADAQRVDLPASCRGGVCGTCVSKLLSGRVDMGWAVELCEGNVLTPEMMEAGYILPCSAKPLTDLVVEYSDDWGVSVLEEWKHTART